MKASVADAAGRMSRRTGRSATRMRSFNSRRSREAGAVASARSSAAVSLRTRCPPPGVSKRVDHGFSVADRPRHLSRYGRLISGPGGRGTARSVVRPVLTSAETLSAIGIDQDRDGGRGGRLDSDPRRPEFALRSARFHGAEPGLNSILATRDAFFASWKTEHSSERPNAKQAARIGGFVERWTPAGMPAGDSAGAHPPVKVDDC
jgi:hypothetical protein